MLINTGRSMRELSTLDLFDAAYASMVRSSLLNEDERKVVDSVDKHISDASFEKETGMPAITRWMPPANADSLPSHLMQPDGGEP